MILPREQLELEELASANSARQTGQHLGAGETGRRWRMRLLKTINISPCIQLLCPHCAPLCPSGEKEWHKMHLGQRKRGINSQHRNDNSFLLSVWFVGSLSKPTASLHTHLISVGGKGLGDKVDIAAGTWELWTQNRNTSREGRSFLNLPSTMCLQLWQRVEEGLTKCSKGVVNTGL